MKKGKLFSEKLVNLVDNGTKINWIIISALYFIFVIVFAIIVVNANGGFRQISHAINNYPEQEYLHLEEELQNIIVENDGIYPQKLSGDSVKYDLSYKETSDSEGKYTIVLSKDSVTITGTISRDLKKENLVIEREYGTGSEYKKQTLIHFIAGQLLLPILPTLFSMIFFTLLFLIFYLILIFIEWYRSRNGSKNN